MASSHEWAKRELRKQSITKHGLTASEQTASPTLPAPRPINTWLRKDCYHIIGMDPPAATICCSSFRPTHRQRHKGVVGLEPPKEELLSTLTRNRVSSLLFTRKYSCRTCCRHLRHLQQGESYGELGGDQEQESCISRDRMLTLLGSSPRSRCGRPCRHS